MKATTTHSVQTTLDQDIARLMHTNGHRQAAPGRRTTPVPFAFKRIVAALDDSEASRYVVPWAQRMAEASGARVWVMNVALERRVYEDYAEWAKEAKDSRSLYQRNRELADRSVRAAARRLRATNLEAVPVVREGFPAPQLLNFLKAVRSDLVIVGSHGRGRLGRVFLGSIADQVKNHTEASVLVAKSPARTRHVLMATDGSAESKRACGLGLHLAQKWGSQPTILHVIETPTGWEAHENTKRVRKQFAGLGYHAGAPSPSFLLSLGHPAGRIIAFAKERDADLIVMGSRGRSGLVSLVAGSVSNRVAHDAPTSVLLVKSFRGTRRTGR